MREQHHDSVRPIPESDVQGWSAEADVLIVGAGGAGLAAAVEACRSGADVLMVERAGGGGGATALSGGEIYLGGGTSLQRACRVRDTPEAMFAFLELALGPGVDRPRLQAYCEGSPEHFEWFVHAGVPFKASVWDEPAYIPTTDDGLMWLGENTHPFVEVAAPAPRGHRPRIAHSGGRLIAEKLIEAARQAGARTTADTAVQNLVVAADGRVVGVRARRYGADTYLRARRAVVLASGGFAYDEQMLCAHVPQLIGHSKIGTEGDDGRGIRLGQSVGGVTRSMGSAQVAIWASPALMCQGLLVNRQGQRFINEDTYPGRIGQRALFWQGGEVYLVIDEQGFEDTPPELRMGQRPTWVAETLEELEQELALPGRSLQATVEVYNTHAAGGTDPVFHKRERFVRPLRSPFAAIDLRGRPGHGGDRSGYLVFTLGGLLTTPDGAVLDIDGAEVPGLFAAGRVSAGIPAVGYISGTSVGDATFFGRRAGRSAAVAPS